MVRRRIFINPQRIFRKEESFLNPVEILDYFSFLADLQEEERDRYLPLCSAAADDLSLQLRRPPKNDTEQRQLNRAAACLAFSQNCVEGEESFQAGDIRVTHGGSHLAQDGYQIWREARCSVSPLLKDGEFSFSQVRV